MMNFMLGYREWWTRRRFRRAGRRPLGKSILANLTYHLDYQRSGLDALDIKYDLLPRLWKIKSLWILSGRDGWILTLTESNGEVR